MCLYVRKFSVEESETLSRWLHRPSSVVVMRRAQILAYSGQGMRVQQIAALLDMQEEYLRRLIRQFNADGFEAIRPRRRRGKSPTLTEEEQSVIREVAGKPPRMYGQKFNKWSLRKLRRYLVDQRGLIPPVSHVTIGTVLKAGGVSYQRTRTWMESDDPDFDAKKNASSDCTGGRRKTAS